MKNSKKLKKKSANAAPNSKTSTKFALTQSEHESLEEFLSRQGIQEHDWDFVIVGDGSGSNWDKEAGWASVTVEKTTMERLVWTGGMNKGTVNFAEIMAYMQPLNWLATREEDRRSKGKVRRQAYKVHIITDSDYCRSTGNSANRLVTKNAVLWSAFDVFKRMGFLLTWHWIPRASCGLNSYCDELSKLARLLVKKYNLQEKLELATTPTRTVYDINPWRGQ